MPETIIGLSVTAEADGKSPWFLGQLLHSEARHEGTHKTTKEVLGGVRIRMALQVKSSSLSLWMISVNTGFPLQSEVQFWWVQLKNRSTPYPSSMCLPYGRQ